MIRLHSTKKLLAKLPVDEGGYLPGSRERARQSGLKGGVPEPSLLGDWHANLLIIQRRNCVLFVHDQTRFPVFVPALKKPELANLDRWFQDALMNTLLKCSATDNQLQAVADHLQPLKIDTDCDRSVQGTLNQMAQDLDPQIYYDHINVAEITGYRTSAWLASGPRTRKGHKDSLWPVREFLALVDALPSIGVVPTAPVSGPTELHLASDDKVVDLASYRRSRN